MKNRAGRDGPSCLCSLFRLSPASVFWASFYDDDMSPFLLGYLIFFVCNFAEFSHVNLVAKTGSFPLSNLFLPVPTYLLKHSLKDLAVILHC